MIQRKTRELAIGQMDRVTPLDQLQYKIWPKNDSVIFGSARSLFHNIFLKYSKSKANATADAYAYYACQRPCIQ